MKHIRVTAPLLISSLHIENDQLNVRTLGSMLQTMSHEWIYFIDHVDLLERKYRNHENLTTLAAFVLSQLYFYANRLEEAIVWTLRAGDLFNVEKRGLYTDNMIVLVINRYVELKNTKGELADSRREELNACEIIVEKVLESSYTLSVEADKKLLLGLAIETNKPKFITSFIKKVSDHDLSAFFRSVYDSITLKENKEELIQIFANEFEVRDGKDLSSLSKCYFSLNQYKKQANLLASLFHTQKEMCYQLALDIQDSGDLIYIANVSELLIAQIGKDQSEHLMSVLSGALKDRINMLFLSQNNNSDHLFLKKVLNRWKSKHSLSTNAVTFLLCTALYGTNDINLLKDFKEKLGAVKNWSLFTLAGSLGLTFPTKFNAIAAELQLNQNSQFYKGGMYLADGLGNFGRPMTAERKDELFAKLQVKDEAVVHGAVLNLGLRLALSDDQEAIERLETHLFGESATKGEAAGYALGLLKATNFDIGKVEELINASRNNQHDRIARSMMSALGLMALGNKSKVDGYFDRLISEQDYVLRIGAAQMLAMAYFGTGDNAVIGKLLRIAATDLSDDVRRAAVLGLGFVMIRKRQKALTIFNMLSTSYNAFVRHAVALSLGIIGAHSFDKKIIKTCKKLLEDKTDHVRQAAAIALGMVLQLGNESLESSFLDVRKTMLEKLEKKHESEVAKIGYHLGFGLMAAGGGNCVINIYSEAGTLKIQSAISVYLFTQFWYWYPLANFIGLAFEPTYLVGVTKDLKIPMNFTFTSRAPKKIFDYHKTQEEVEEKKVEKGPVVLSSTKRAQARRENKDGKTDNRDMIIEEATDAKEPELAAENVEGEAKKAQLQRNASRVLKRQLNYIDLKNKSQRYEVALQERKIGIVFLVDKRENEKETYLDELPAETWMIPPLEFVFDEKANK